MLLIYKFFDYSHSPPKRSPCSTHAQNVFRSLLWRGSRKEIGGLHKAYAYTP